IYKRGKRMKKEGKGDLEKIFHRFHNSKRSFLQGLAQMCSSGSSTEFLGRYQAAIVGERSSAKQGIIAFLCLFFGHSAHDRSSSREKMGKNRPIFNRNLAQLEQRERREREREKREGRRDKSGERRDKRDKREKEKREDERISSRS